MTDKNEFDAPPATPGDLDSFYLDGRVHYSPLLNVTTPASTPSVVVQYHPPQPQDASDDILARIREAKKAQDRLADLRKNQRLHADGARAVGNRRHQLIARCGCDADVVMDQKTGRIRLEVVRCGQRGCPRCGRGKSRRRARALLHVLRSASDLGYAICLLTFTLKRRPHQTAKQALERFNRVWGRFAERVVQSADNPNGIVYGMTLGIDDAVSTTSGHHVHGHVVAAVLETDVPNLVDIWSSCAGMSGGKPVGSVVDFGVIPKATLFARDEFEVKELSEHIGYYSKAAISADHDGFKRPQILAETISIFATAAAVRGRQLYRKYGAFRAKPGQGKRPAHGDVNSNPLPTMASLPSRPPEEPARITLGSLSEILQDAARLSAADRQAKYPGLDDAGLDALIDGAASLFNFIHEHKYDDAALGAAGGFHPANR